MARAADLEFALSEIRKLSRNPTSLNDAEKRLSSLIESMPPAELAESENLIKDVIARCFLPKRQKRLRTTLATALGAPPSGAGPGDVVSPAPLPTVSAADALNLFRSDVHAALIDLADRHIFQWALYEVAVAGLFDKQAPAALARGVHLVELQTVLRNEVASHAAEIFQRGFAYATNYQQLSTSTALAKSTSGLLRFLDMVLSEYRRQLLHLRAASAAPRLRAICSALVTGILLGRCKSTFGALSGTAQLADVWKLWAHTTPFMMRGDMEQFTFALQVGHVRDRLNGIIQPLVAALDEQSSRPEPDGVCVLRSASFDRTLDRLELILVEPIRLADKEIPVHCYLTSSSIDRLELESAANRDMQLILAPLTDELDRWISSHATLRRIVVDTAKGDAPERLRDALSFAVASLGSTAREQLPVTYNYAKRFPLDRPDIGVDFRVPRRSVQALLEQHQHQTGVRLWCSVRRSGKTTACLDLQTVRGSAAVITETCERIGVANLTDSFYQAVLEALRENIQLKSTFVADAIRRSADYDVGSSKIVFVLDEYESLFRQLELAARDDERRRYSVVQPVLNQLLEFAQRNLVVFLGLRPDAHYILMDQNQLSPYVLADSFPLFEFEQEQPDSEFRDLVRRILTDRIQCDDAFLGHVYSETRGHPALTVNVLTAVCEWLIKTKRPLGRLSLGGGDFDDFGAACLTPSAISLEDAYDLHRHFCAQGLSEASRQRTPWLYSVLQVLRLTAKRSHEQMSCTFEEARRLLDGLGVSHELGCDIKSLSRSGAKANFFELKEHAIKPKIRLLARIAGTVVPPTPA